MLAPQKTPDANLATLKQFYSDLADWISGESRHGCMLINLMALDGERNASFDQRVRNYLRRVDCRLPQLLTGTAEREEMLAGDNEARSRILVGLMLGLNMLARASSSRSELDPLVDAIKQQIYSWRVNGKSSAR